MAAGSPLCPGSGVRLLLGIPDRACDAQAFVHVPREYPARRRAQRLSFAVWVLLDPLVEGAREQARQPVLETKDTASRLRAAIARISEINAALRTYKESGGL